MKSKIYISVLVTCVLATLACSKESSDDMPRSFAKIVNDSLAYISRNSVELADGAIVLACVGKENPFQSNNYGNAPAFLVKYAQSGDLLWKETLPESVYELWQILELSNSNILVLGYEKGLSPERVGAVIYTPDGAILNQHSFINQTRSFDLVRSSASVNGLELSNGNIGLVMPSITVANGITYPRLVILDPELNLVHDEKYADAPVSAHIMTQMSLAESNDQQLMILGKIIPYLNLTETYFGFGLTLAANTFEASHYELLAAETESQKFKYPSNVVYDGVEAYVWATTGAINEGGAIDHEFNMRDMERYAAGKEIQIWKSGLNAESQMQMTFSSFPKNGYISQIRKCADGGYVLIGTCNINDNLNVPSNFRCLLAKLNASYSLEWIESYDFGTPTLGNSISETHSGFIVSATQLAFDDINKPLLFKTDKSGQLN